MGSPNPYVKLVEPLQAFTIEDYPRATCEEVLVADMEFTVSADGTSTDLLVVNAGNSTAIVVTFLDESGGSVSEKFATVTTGDTATVDTSSLNANDCWKMRVKAYKDVATDQNDATTQYYIDIKNPKGATGVTTP